MITNEYCVSAQCPVIGGTIAYRIVNEHATGLPLIVVHGGPGTPHNYLASLASLLPERQVIFYDQLDCGLSTKTNNPQWWQKERFVDEIEKLSQHLGLQQFNLYAHSAGTMYAFDYALAYPDKITNLVLASPVLSINAYLASMHELLTTFPEHIQTAFRLAMEQNKTNTLELMEATAYFAEHHMCRLPVWPDELFESSVNTNIQLRNYMWGCNDFLITGNLKDYERLSCLSEFKVKTLITVGEHDFISPTACKEYVELMNNAQLAIILGASHNPHLEQPKLYGAILHSWLESSQKNALSHYEANCFL
ncbi:proline iminopeptidase [Legionella gratiana]|uniref:Proline iminopeptidase n=1 Tax=Legionella gratiana TaxID=45066 RepID=A0A378J4Y8_9GAMM|nr:proline iminopeptidase-family hydrolase [Legionella gratiana]KTD14510.1 proline iminopeptidase [Legionella gratiana]STX41977.1 proline iminopeptidase [Legionella gratiana]